MTIQVSQAAIDRLTTELNAAQGNLVYYQAGVAAEQEKIVSYQAILADLEVIAPPQQ